MRASDLAFWRRASPARLTAGTFLGLIALGTSGLHFLPALYVSGTPLGWIDALFTATSAICVTGLIVVDTATHFTRLGQGYLLLLIQLGGLGMITLTSLLILGLGGRLSVRAESVATSMASSIAAAPGVNAFRLVRDVVLFTLAFEGLGALLLFGAFASEFPLGDALWHAVFHAVSAFCNAGFSTFTDSLIGWQGHAAVLLPVMALIVAGGLGFLTLEEVALRRRTRQRVARPRLSLHSRLVFSATALAVVVGALLFTAFEWEGALRELSPGARVLGGTFMSVTARTAGFNTIDYALATDATNFLTILLMTVGGAPGSTAGGLKITTVVVIGLLAWSRMRGNTSVSLWSRTIPDETVQRAIGVTVFAFTVVAIAVFLLTTTEIEEAPGTGFLRVVFEAVSAFNTVGLSLGSLGHLEPPSRVLVTVLMFIGRVGPLSFAAALALRAREVRPRISFAREDVSIG
jgi:trk system potassium uptake protein TrkH